MRQHFRMSTGTRMSRSDRTHSSVPYWRSTAARACRSRVRCHLARRGRRRAAPAGSGMSFRAAASSTRAGARSAAHVWPRQATPCIARTGPATRSSSERRLGHRSRALRGTASGAQWAGSASTVAQVAQLVLASQPSASARKWSAVRLRADEAEIA